MSLLVEPTSGTDTDRTYSVHRCEYGVWVMGSYAPVGDASALLRAWDYAGYKTLALAVAQRLGALVAVCETSGDERVWLASLNGESK